MGRLFIAKIVFVESVQMAGEGQIDCMELPRLCKALHSRDNSSSRGDLTPIERRCSVLIYSVDYEGNSCR